MKKKFIVLLFVTFFIMAGCSENSAEATAKKQQEVANCQITAWAKGESSAHCDSEH